MPLNIKDLFGYNWYLSRRLLKSMAEIPWETVTENSGVSFDSIRDIFVHSLQAEHFWIRRLNGKNTEGILGAQLPEIACSSPMISMFDRALKSKLILEP
jgi:uncharacterized damage-inducible protein DinB